MASSISNLTALLLNPYAQNTAQAAQLRPQIAPIKPGTNVTARYSVQEDGELALRGITVTPQKLSDAASEQSTADRRRQSPSYNFSDISKPRISLAPSDEIALFAPNNSAAGSPFLLRPPEANARADAGITDVVFEEEVSPGADAVNLAAQKQQRVAGLYARNADITFNINPVFSEAA